MFLNPTDALHGDLGIVSKHDLVVLFSKSGNTEELIRLVPYAKVVLSPLSLILHPHLLSHPLLPFLAPGERREARQCGLP